MKPTNPLALRLYVFAVRQDFEGPHSIGSQNYSAQAIKCPYFSPNEKLIAKMIDGCLTKGRGYTQRGNKEPFEVRADTFEEISLVNYSIIPRRGDAPIRC